MMTATDVTHRIVSTTVPYPAEPFTDFLRRFGGQPRFQWAREGDALQFAAAGYAAMLKSTLWPEVRFEATKNTVRKLFSWLIHDVDEVPKPVGPKVFGGFAFSPGPITESVWASFGVKRFMLPRYLLTLYEGEHWLTTVQVAGPDDDLDEVLAAVHADIELLPPLQHDIQRQDESQTTDVITAEAWAAMITDATDRIRAGELEKVVLSRARHMTNPVDVPTALERLAGDYPGCFRFLMEFEPGHAFLGATPEVLVRVKHPRLETVALAGSIGRGETPAADTALAEALMNSAKDRHEHALVVEAIREAMEPITTAVFIDDEPDLHKLANIQHLSTPIYGWLERGENLIDLVERLHPTPALGGHPREAALKLLTELEPHQRGWYGAPVGWLGPDGGGLFAVAIRSALITGDVATLYAGAGIVADSQPDTEWRETALKFRPMMEALA